MVFLGVVVAGCGGSGNPEDGGQAPPVAATRSASPRTGSTTGELPAHDPNAKFDGKTALEYAEGLSDLNPDRRVQALSTIAKFGVDGLPARDRVRAVFESDPIEEVRMVALVVLVAIKDPGAVPLAIGKLLDPAFSDSDDLYAGLLGMLEESGADESALRPGVMQLVGANPDHAARLMSISRLPAAIQRDLTLAVFAADHGELARRYFIDNLGKLDVLDADAHLDYVVSADLEHAIRLLSQNTLPPETRSSLARAVFEADHNDQAAAYFLGNLGALEFLDDEARIAYIRSRRPVAARSAAALQPYLLSVGTAEAMKLALDLLAINAPSNMFPNKRFPVMIRFVARGRVEPAVVMDEMLQLVNESTTQELIDEYTSYMAALPREVLAAEQQAEELRIAQAIRDQELTAAEAQQQRTRNRTEGLRTDRTRAANDAYLAAVTGLMNEGPSETHRAFGVLRLIEFIQETPGVPLSPTLDPVYALLGDASAPDIVRGTAGDHLQKAAAALVVRDPESFIAMTAAALWGGGDVNATHFPEQILIAAGRQPAHAAAVLDAITEGASDKLGHWAINPVAAVIMQLAAIPTVKKTPTVERASVVLGKIFASPQAHPGYLKKPYDSSFHRVMSSDTNTIDGYIGILEPFVFAESPTFLDRNNPTQWASSMANPTTGSLAFTSGPEAMQRWRAFLRRVVDTSGNKTYVSFATTGLSQLDAAIQRGW